jgi:uncharacterized Zn-finger protein
MNEKILKLENKPYQCDKLGEVCSQKHPLQTHIRTHTGDKPYKCDICDEVFHDLNLTTTCAISAYHH